MKQRLLPGFVSVVALVVVVPPAESLVADTPPPAVKVTQELTAFLSRDDGKTWSKGLLLDERVNVSYPDVAQAPNGGIYVHYDRDRYGAAEILFARFREEDVKAGTISTPGSSLKNVVKSKAGMKTGASP